MSSYEKHITRMIQNAFGMECEKTNSENKMKYSAVLSISAPRYLCVEGEYLYYGSDLGVIFKNKTCKDELTKSLQRYCKENNDISLLPVLQTENSKYFAKLIYKMKTAPTGSISDQVVRSYNDYTVRQQRM